MMLHVLRVFTSSDAGHGNPLGVFLDGSEAAVVDRQAIAADLGFSETVFVDDSARGEMRIFTPSAELSFAGHPTVGTAWLLEHLGSPVHAVRPPAGEVLTWQEEDLRWIRGRPEWVHPITMEQLPSAAAVEDLSSGPSGEGSYYAWAWIDEGAGIVRSRYFVPSLGIGEDQATGAAAVVLGARLGRDRDPTGHRISAVRAPGPEWRGRCWGPLRP